MEDLGLIIKRRLDEMIVERQPYEDGLWKDIARFVNPRRENISSSSLTLPKGQRRGKDCYDGTPLAALLTWRDGMIGHSVSRALDWFRSTLADPDLSRQDDVRGWLQKYDMSLYSAIRRSNFYDVLPEWFADAGSIGTATIFTEEDIETKTAVHECVHPREIYISEDKFSRVDTVYRQREFTARQALEKFKDDSLSDIIKTAAEKNPLQKFVFVHAVFPNTDKAYGKISTKNKKWRSVYVEMGSSFQVGNVKTNIVRDSGYDFNPYTVWRFRKNSDETYGYSPAADSIVEIFTLNQVGKDLLDASHLSVNPPLNVPMHLRNKVQWGPRGYNYFENSNDIVSAINPGFDYPVGKDQLDRLQRSLEDKYRVDYFRMLDRAEREMTATEIIERNSEKSILLTSQVDVLSEGLRQLLSIISYIEDRAKRLPPDMPQSLAEYVGGIDIEFIGPLAQAQKRLFEARPIISTLQEIGNAAQYMPQEKIQEMWDCVDIDITTETLLESGSFPQTCIIPKDKRDKARQLRAEAMARQQQLAEASAMAEAVPKLSKSIEKGSPAEMIANAV